MSKLILPPGPFDAFLFDCDGTIADSMPLHYIAWCQAMEGWNCAFTEEQFYALAGVPVPRTVEMLNEEQGLEMPPEEISRRREEIYYGLLHQVRPIEEVVEKIHEFYAQIPLAVVSGSPRESVIKTLGFLGLLDRFDTIVGAEDYRHGKPHPEPFLTAAERLGVTPDRCLVFEDGEPGVRSAVAAGMQYVRIPSSLERSRNA